MKITKDDKGQDTIPSIIEHFYKYKPVDKEGKTKGADVPMVRIKGNFFGGGFNLSKNKVKAVLDNLDILQKFAKGDFDKEINVLKPDEVLQP